MHSVTSTRKIFITVMWLASIFAGSAFAQDCETYDLHGTITNERGKPVKGALVDLFDNEPKTPMESERSDKPLVKVTSGRDGTYVIRVIDLTTYNQRGDSITHFLRVTAPGFMSYQVKVDIALCGFKLDVKLTKMKRPAGKGDKKL